MLAINHLPLPRLPLAGFAIVLLAALAACSVHEDRKNGEKKVDIKTPFANLKVNTDAGPADTGLPAYPGARRKPGDEHNSHAANVDLSGFGFGLKVSVVEFESDDPVDKVLAFYKDKLKTYGNVLECPDTDYVDIFDHDRDKDSDQLTCGKRKHRGGAVELKVGTPEKQRVVAVKQRGSGSEFALVYVHKQEGTM